MDHSDITYYYRQLIAIIVGLLASSVMASVVPDVAKTLVWGVWKKTGDR